MNSQISTGLLGVITLQIVNNTTLYLQLAIVLFTGAFQIYNHIKKPKK